MNILLTARLSDYKLASKLQGLIHNENISNIYLVRRQPLDISPKIINIQPKFEFVQLPIIYHLWNLYTLFRLTKKTKPTFIWGIHLFNHGYAAAIIGRITRTPFVISIIGSEIHGPLTNGIKLILEKFTLSKAAAAIVLGSHSRQTALRAGMKTQDTFEIQNCHDQKFRPLNRTKKCDLFFAGDLLPRKKINILIQAVANIKKSFPEISLHIAGEGPQKQKLIKLSKQLDLSENITFLSNVGDIENHLNQSRLVVLISDMEGCAAITIEAMLCGIPSIITDVGDMRSVFSEQNARFVELDSPDKTAQAVLGLLQNPKQYEQLAQSTLTASQHFIKQWDQQAQVRHWDRVLVRFLQAKNSQTQTAAIQHQV